MNELVELIPVEETTERGNIRRNPLYDKAREVYARMLSVGEREFYDSVQAGFELELKLEVWAWEYEGEKIVRYDGVEYSVVRVYRNKQRMAELSCEKIKGRNA